MNVPRFFRFFASPLLWVLPGVFFSTTTTAGLTKEMQDKITGALRATAQAQYPDARIAVEVNELDPRLTLRACTDHAIDVKGQRAFGRVHVLLSCRKPVPWKIYLTANVSVEVGVLVATRDIPRGSRLTSSDARLVRRDLSQIRGQAITAKADLNQYRTRRLVRAGNTLDLGALAAAPAISKGEVIRLQSGTAAIRIIVQARALEDGQVGEQIRVENLQSGRTIAGWVVEAGLVATRPVFAEKSRIEAKVTTR